MMDDSASKWSGSLSELKQSWVERAPRGIEHTRDHAIGMVARGDGTFDVYHLATCWRMLTGRIGTHGTALVLFDNDWLRTGSASR